MTEQLVRRFVRDCDKVQDPAVRERYGPVSYTHLDVYKRQPQAAGNYIRYLSGRIRFLSDRLDGLLVGSAERRLALYLLEREEDCLLYTSIASARSAIQKRSDPKGPVIGVVGAPDPPSVRLQSLLHRSAPAALRGGDMTSGPGQFCQKIVSLFQFRPGTLHACLLYTSRCV